MARPDPEADLQLKGDNDLPSLRILSIRCNGSSYSPGQAHTFAVSNRVRRSTSQVCEPVHRVEGRLILSLMNLVRLDEEMTVTQQRRGQSAPDKLTPR